MVLAFALENLGFLKFFVKIINIEKNKHTLKLCDTVNFRKPIWAQKFNMDELEG